MQLGEAPQLLEVGESGEFKRGTLGESKESYKVRTYGQMVAITRQVLINDDLDAFTRIPAMHDNSILRFESDLPPAGPSFITRACRLVRCSPTLGRRNLEFSGLVTATGWLRQKPPRPRNGK